VLTPRSSRPPPDLLAHGAGVSDLVARFSFGGRPSLHGRDRFNNHHMGLFFRLHLDLQMVILTCSTSQTGEHLPPCVPC